MWRVISNTLAIEVDHVTGSPGSLSVWRINMFTFVNMSIATAHVINMHKMARLYLSPRLLIQFHVGYVKLRG
jgi:hypothetical protein